MKRTTLLPRWCGTGTIGAINRAASPDDKGPSGGCNGRCTHLAIARAGIAYPNPVFERLTRPLLARYLFRVALRTVGGHRIEVDAGRRELLNWTPGTARVTPWLGRESGLLISIVKINFEPD